MATNEHMATTTLFRARVDSARKDKAERVLARLGLRPADAVNMLFAQIAERNAMPFAVALPGALTDYGVTPAELATALSRLDDETQKARTEGTLVVGLDAIEAAIDRRRNAHGTRPRRRAA